MRSSLVVKESRTEGKGRFMQGREIGAQAVEIAVAIGWTTLGVWLGAMMVGARERVVVNAFGVAALHTVITWVLAMAFSGPYGATPWMPIGASLVVMLTLVEIVFGTGWVRSLGITFVGLAVSGWPLFFSVLRALAG
ncbi:MAG: hypothetical protein ABFS34_13845 [Gemmatimonadota bacterium]